MAYTSYYREQAGSGIQGYQAFRTQRGRGIFGTLWRKIAWPLLKYAGKKAVNIGLDVGKDAAYGMNMKDSIKSRLKEHGPDIVDEIAEKAKSVLRGRGKKRVYRRRKRKRSISVIKKKRNKIQRKTTKKKKRQVRRKRRKSKIFA